MQDNPFGLKDAWQVEEAKEIWEGSAPGVMHTEKQQSEKLD